MTGNGGGCSTSSPSKDRRWGWVIELRAAERCLRCVRAVSGTASRLPDSPCSRWPRAREVDGANEETRSKMDRAVRDCLVSGYEPLIAGLYLPDPDDCHVLAAAMFARTDFIVTFNLRDFPAE